MQHVSTQVAPRLFTYRYGMTTHEVLTTSKHSTFVSVTYACTGSQQTTSFLECISSWYPAQTPASLQVTANNLSVVHPSGLEPPTPPPNSLLLRGPTGRLTALSDALQACLTCPLPHDIMLALLLSSVTAGVPATPPSQTNDTAARNQVCELPDGIPVAWDAVLHVNSNA